MQLQDVERARGSAVLTVPVLRSGKGRAAGHVGEIPQVWARHNGETKVLLSSLPCPLFSTAEVILDDSEIDWHVLPADRTRSLHAAAITARELGHKAGGWLVLDSTDRVGAGLGTSGREVAAAIKATYAAAGHPPPAPADLIRLIRASGDTALDSTLLDFPCVTASRTFEIANVLARPLPELLCVAFDSAPERVVITGETYLAAPRHQKTITHYTTLLTSFVDSVSTGDVLKLGLTSTECCRLGQQEVFNPLLESAIEVCQSEKALGLARSYTGTFLTAILAPTDPDAGRKAINIYRAFAEFGAAEPFLFLTTGTEIQHVSNENGLSAIRIHKTPR